MKTLGKGRLYVSKGRVTFVASGQGGGCPTASIIGESARLRDDYSGRIKVRVEALKGIFG